MKLSELKTPDLRSRLISTFRLGTLDATEVSQYIQGNREWEELSDQARTKIFSHYENDPDNVGKRINPLLLLKKDFQ